MPPILFADGFLTGSLLSLLLPVGLLIAVVVGFILALRRLPGGTGGSPAPGPSAAGTLRDGVAGPADPPVSPRGPSDRRAGGRSSRRGTSPE